MRKLLFALSIIMLLTSFNLTAFAVEDTPAMRWEDIVNTGFGGGYPRMAQRADGTLLLTTDGGYIYHSIDNAKTFKQQLPRAIDSASNTATVIKNGKTYSFTGLTRANLQPFVVSDGTVLLGYRCHTNTGSAEYASSGHFYTSIRVMTSNNGGMSFDRNSEEILIEDANLTSTNGYWEPFFVQVDEDTVLCYFADDLNVDKLGSQQRIAYVEYDVPTKTWDKTPKTAIYRKGLKTRDGMPMITELVGGGYAMVVEVQDFGKWNKTAVENGVLGVPAKFANCVFAVGLSLSEDGRTWSDPVPVLAPTNLTRGMRCSAPSVATLPDGRLVITCQTDEFYDGFSGASVDNECVMSVAISDAPVTKESVITPIDPLNPKEDGAAVGFTRLSGVLDFAENQFSIWNAVFGFGNDIYFLGGTAFNNDSSQTAPGSGSVYIRHLVAFKDESEAACYDDARSRAGSNAFLTVYGKAENGIVKLGMPIGANADNAHVYKMAVGADGNKYLSEMVCKAENGKLIFSGTDGYYAVTNAPLVAYGDATGDGNVTMLDAVRIARQSLKSLNGVDNAACDINGSLSVDTSDALDVARMLLD